MFLMFCCLFLGNVQQWIEAVRQVTTVDTRFCKTTVIQRQCGATVPNAARKNEPSLI